MTVPAGSRTIAASPHDWRRWAVPVALLVLAAIPVGIIASTLSVRAPLTNEGWNATYALRALTVPNLYATDGYASFPNYPPLAFYPVAWLGLLVGDNIIAARLIATTALLGVAILVGTLARQLGATLPAAVTAAALYLVLTFGMAHYYAGVGEPQLLGHALQLGGLLALVAATRNPASRAALFVPLAALLMVLGGLVKLNLIVLPLAATLWLALAHRRLLAGWLISATLFCLIALALCWALFGSAIFQQVLGHERVYDLALVPASVRWMAGYLPFAIAGLVLLRRGNDPAFGLLAAWLTAAVLLGLVFAGGVGVNLNNYFEVGIAAALAFGLGLRHWSALGRGARLLVLGLSVVTVAYLAVTSLGPWRGRAMAASEAAELAPVIAEIAAVPGPAACLDMALCYWAGKASLVDGANTYQRLLAGPEAATAFRDSLAASAPAIIQLDPSGRSAASGALAPLLEEYTLLREQPVRLYLRRDLAPEPQP